MAWKYNPFTGRLDYYEAAGAITGAESHSTTFVNADLAAGVYTYTHSLASARVMVQVRNNSGKVIDPDDITRSDDNTELIDLSSYGALTGTWSVGAVALA